MREMRQSSQHQCDFLKEELITYRYLMREMRQSSQHQCEFLKEELITYRYLMRETQSSQHQCEFLRVSYFVNLEKKQSSSPHLYELLKSFTYEEKRF